MKQNYHIFIIIALCSLLVSNANAQTLEPTSFTERLDSIVNSDGSKRIFEYDAKNRLIKDFNYKDENGELIPSSNGYEYKYNEEGKELEQRCYYNGSLADVTTYSYEGNLCKGVTIGYNGENISSKSTSIIDMTTNNKLFYETFYYGSNGGNQIESGSSDEYTYDNYGNLVDEKHYTWKNNKWEADREILYEYDNRGNRTKETHCLRQDFSVSYELQYEYDANGNVVKGSEYNYADNGQWCLYAESIMQYNGKQMIKRTITVRNEQNGDIAYSTRISEEYDSKGNRVKYENKLYDNKYDRYGDLTESVVFYEIDGTMYSYRKTDFSWDSEGNRVVVIYDHNTNYLYSLNTAPWYAKEKHVIKTNDMDGIIEVKAYKYKDNKWHLMYEQLHGESKEYGWSKINDYLDDYNLNDERRMRLPTIYFQRIYDEDGKFVGYGDWRNEIDDNKYGGYSSYLAFGSLCIIWGGNQYNQTMYSKYEDIYNNSSETVTDEYYDDFTPIIQTSYSNGEETSKTTYSYDWTINAESIASLSKVTNNPHKILSEETINTNGETSFTRYYYSPINATTGIRNSQATHIGQATIFDVTGKQHNSLQKGLNIINEGGKVRKVIVK